ncbi:MAG: sulfur carrier protein ThiS [Deltaproteobacteria bacterium]|nr:sulfur carrier protein ThiS [Deltaproteobacteria bacterium]
MKLMVNGKLFETKEKTLVIDFLLKEKNVESPEMVSVELNGRIIKRDDFAQIELQENDQVEFLYFMGGGQNSYE